MDFLFLGEALALDLVNTQVMVRGKPGDLLQTPDNLEKWWEQAHTRFTPALAKEVKKQFDLSTLEQLKTLRDTLRRMLKAIVEKHSPETGDQIYINQLLSAGHQALDWNTTQTPRGTYCLTQDTEVHPLAFEVALSFLRLLTEQDLARLHKCRNERCILYFYDTTKSATRHWCSTGCMNRARSIENYRSKKLVEATQD